MPPSNIRLVSVRFIKGLTRPWMHTLTQGQSSAGVGSQIKFGEITALFAQSREEADAYTKRWEPLLAITPNTVPGCEWLAHRIWVDDSSIETAALDFAKHRWGEARMHSDCGRSRAEIEAQNIEYEEARAGLAALIGEKALYA